MVAQPCLPISPELHKDGSVTFRLQRPYAREVLVRLDGLAAPLRMTTSDGVWSATAGPLVSGSYCYSYQVDGRTELDPLNPEVMPNYAFLNSAFRIPELEKAPWECTDSPHGTVHHHFYGTKIVKGLRGGQSEYFVYTPPEYEENSSTAYPTLYLLHGLSQGAADWTAMGRANFVLDNLIADGMAKPMIAVMPLGYGDMAVANKQPSESDFAPMLFASNALFADVLFTELIPRVEADYRAAKHRQQRAIAGLSMGGAQSLDIGLNSNGEFAWIGGFSAADAFVPRTSARDSANELQLLWMSCGTEDWLLNSNRKLVGNLKESGYEVSLTETPGAHSWPVWQRNLAEFVQLLFTS